MALTLAERLTSVQTAIAKIEGGAQSWQAEGVSVTRADLRTLYARERELELRIERASHHGRTVAEF